MKGCPGPEFWTFLLSNLGSGLDCKSRCGGASSIAACNLSPVHEGNWLMGRLN